MFRKKTGTTLGLISIILVIFSIAFVPGVNSQQEKGPIKIGYIGAAATPYGVSNKTALEISIEDLNKAGGIAGRQVQLVVEDWKREVPLAVAAYKKLVITNGCPVVVTEGTDSVMANMQEGGNLYKEYPHIQFGTWAAGNEITDRVGAEYNKFKFVFRIFGKVEEVYDPRLDLPSFFRKNIGTKKLAVVVEDSSFGQNYINGFPAKNLPPWGDFLAQKSGAQLVYKAKSAVGEKMFLPILEKIAASGADTINWITAYTDTLTLTKQWFVSSAKDIDLVLESGAVGFVSFWNMTGGAALGVCAKPPEADIPYTDKTLPFLKELRKRGAGLLSGTFGSADMPWILKAAVEKTGNTKDIDALIKALETVEVQNYSWRWKFDKNHDPVKGYPYFLSPYGQFQGPGQYVVVHPDDVRRLANNDKLFMRVKELRARVVK